jgi:hypothetical protein
MSRLNRRQKPEIYAMLSVVVYLSVPWSRPRIQVLQLELGFSSLKYVPPPLIAGEDFGF